MRLREMVVDINGYIATTLAIFEHRQNSAPCIKQASKQTNTHTHTHTHMTFMFYSVFSAIFYFLVAVAVAVADVA